MRVAVPRPPEDRDMALGHTLVLPQPSKHLLFYVNMKVARCTPDAYSLACLSWR